MSKEEIIKLGRQAFKSLSKRPRDKSFFYDLAHFCPDQMDAVCQSEEDRKWWEIGFRFGSEQRALEFESWCQGYHAGYQSCLSELMKQ